MAHKGKVITDNAKKADIFMKHYAAESRLIFTKEERSINRYAKSSLRTRQDSGEGCESFTRDEFEVALRKQKKKGAAGPDDIPPTFLCHLGDKAKDELLAIFNVAFNESKCPQEWRNAIIIPLLKSGKDAGAIDSYRPISRTGA